MAQLHLYVPDDVAEQVKKRAHAMGRSLSAYLADLVMREIRAEWPKGYFDDIVGGWSGRALVRAPQGEPERRDDLV